VNSPRQANGWSARTTETAFRGNNMARFKADIEGQKGSASRLGSAKSGMRAHVRGWNVGARVVCSVNEDGEDVVSICLTGGSANPSFGRVVGQYTEADLVKDDAIQTD